MHGAVRIIPAIMPDSAEHLHALVRRVSAFAKWIQIDVMDGKFVPPKSFPYTDTTLDIPKLPYENVIFYEVHLMIADPQDMGRLFIEVGAHRIVAQIESFNSLETARQCLSHWRASGAEVGISLLINTPLEDVIPLIDEGAVDVVQVMSIAEIGYQGRPFDERAIERVRRLREMYPKLTISVDGGVSKESAGTLVGAGANRLCIGSAIMHSPDPLQAYRDIMNVISSV